MSLKEAMWNAGITKVGHLINKDGWLSAEDLAFKINIKSVRMVQKLLNKVKDLFPPNWFFSSESLFEEEQISAFPEIKIAAASGAWLEVEGSLLTFKTPQLELFSDTSKKTLYILCVKVSHLKFIENHKDSKWHEVFGIDVSPKGSWRTLYKPPIEKRTGDLQWRVVHGIIATNRHRAHLDPKVNQECLFCRWEETVFHLFLNCERLIPLFNILEIWCHRLGQVFTPSVFIYGPKYQFNKKETIILVNFLFGQAKLAIWLSRKRKLNGEESNDVVMILIGLIKARVKIEFAYYKLIENIEMFKFKWCVNNCICEVTHDVFLNLYV